MSSSSNLTWSQQSHTPRITSHIPPLNRRFNVSDSLSSLDTSTPATLVPIWVVNSTTLYHIHSIHKRDTLYIITCRPDLTGLTKHMWNSSFTTWTKNSLWGVRYNRSCTPYNNSGTKYKPIYIISLLTKTLITLMT